MAAHKYTKEEIDEMWKASKEADERRYAEVRELSPEEQEELDRWIKSGFADRICDDYSCFK